jgi:hypothetical protein
MAGNGLPIYYKNSKLVVAQSPKKKWKEYYLLVCTIAGFIILIAGVLWFVPSIEEDKSYYRAYNSFTGPSFAGITDSSSEPEIIANPDKPSPLPVESVLKREVENNGPEVDPRQRKLEENRPEPVPGRGRPNDIEGGASPVKEEAGDHQGDPPQGGVDRPGGKDPEDGDGGEDSQEKEDEGVGKAAGEEEGQKEEEDPITKQRRDKIVEVRCVCVNHLDWHMSNTLL